MRCAWIIIAGLAGCGGGQGDTNAPPDADFDVRYDQTAALGVTPAHLLPTTGSYSYAGLIQLTLPIGGAPPTLFGGDFDVTVAFDGGADPLSGTIRHLTDGNTALSGTLAVQNGVLDLLADPITQFQFSADIDGVLSDQSTAYAIDGAIAGDFYGVSGDDILGVAYGDISNGGNIDVFDGTFVGSVTP